MGTPSEEEILAGIKRLILEEKRDVLCKYMNPERYMDHLRSKFVINEEDKEEIEYEKTRRKRASVMIDILLRKGGGAYDVFVSAIQMDRTQTELVQILHLEYERRRNNYFALTAGSQTRRVNTNEGSLPKPKPPVPTASSPPSTTGEGNLTRMENTSTAAASGQDQPQKEDGLDPEKTTEVIYYQYQVSGSARPVNTESRISPVVYNKPSVDMNLQSFIRPTFDHDTESMKQQKEQRNRSKLKFTSRSTDSTEDLDQQTFRKEEMVLPDDAVENTDLESSLRDNDKEPVK